MDVKGKVIWITGATSGIGEALAYELSKKHVKLILSSRRVSELERVKKACSHPEDVRILPLDLEEIDSLHEKAIEAFAFFKNIDILVNNGGISQRSNCLETDISVDEKILRTNLLAPIALSKAFHNLRDNKYDESMIVVTSSLVGKFGTPKRSAYSASKHGLHGFFDSLRAELPTHHKVLIACPGFIKTNVSLNAMTEHGEKQGTMDDAQNKGMSAEKFAEKLIKAIEKDKFEVYIGGRECLGVYLKRFFPNLFAKIIRTAKVT